MLIRRIEVDNFKSLDDFHLELSHFTCLIGLNGSGKPPCCKRWIFLPVCFVGMI